MATARHPKATFFVQRHLFSGLTRFAELESKIAALPDEQARGAAFEVFAEAYLATQRKHDAAQVWPHGSVPLDILKNLGLTQSDQGVDGVLQTLLGEFDAYQIKFRTGTSVANVARTFHLHWSGRQPAHPQPRAAHQLRRTVRRPQPPPGFLLHPWLGLGSFGSR